MGIRQLRRFFGEEDMRRSAINALALQPGDRVLNMCSGLGDNLHLLVSKDIELFAADTNKDNAEACRREIRENRWHNIRALHWNGYQLPFADSSFDAIFITYGFTSSANPESVLAECARLLKPGGRISVIDWITPGKGNGLIAGLLWPLHFLMGCNPYTPWRRQFAEHFEVCKQQKIWADMAAFIYGQKKTAPAGSEPIPATETENEAKPAVSNPQPSNAFCGMQYAQAHEKIYEIQEAHKAARLNQDAAQEEYSQASTPPVQAAADQPAPGAGASPSAASASSVSDSQPDLPKGAPNTETNQETDSSADTPSKDKKNNSKKRHRR
ncbi:MAG: methyltransferase domain-containing protein [bacterium]|nr:methyltransferase domain-containing protein [bacterium]